MTLNGQALPALAEALAILEEGFKSLPDFQPALENPDATLAALQAAALRMQDNYPYHHPNYAGQMLKPPHPVARTAYQLAQWVNPNNHALDGGRASSAMEKEAVTHIAQMVGWGEQHLGHLCSGGTVANMEALWVARERCAPGARLVYGEFSHYTHERLAGVLGIPHSAIPANHLGQMDVTALERELQQGDVGTVVVTLGTTAYGSVDPLADIVALRERYSFRIHVDAAYGGYFCLLNDLPAARHFAAIGAVDSLVIDPHKHGLQPYGCGCVLFANPADGVVYAHDSPYTYFTSDELHLGEISLECSRAGATAVALWATQHALPNTPDGEFAASLRQCCVAAQELHSWLAAQAEWQPLLTPELDVVVWAPTADSFSAANRQAQLVFEQLAERDIHIALVKVPAAFASQRLGAMTVDTTELVCLRVCLMKPEHQAWIPTFTRALGELG